MQLVLWRHAEAEPGIPDAGRRLTARGKRQARRVARWLRRRLAADARVLASPALRAQRTARELTRRFETADALAPGTSPGALLAAVGWPDPGPRTVVVVGHQPTLGEAAALALAGRAEPWALEAGALLWLESRAGEAPRLRAAITPELV
jgi:phosphohistidine phosphatase